MQESLPKRWAVVVHGRWNRAILTPKGIAQRLYGLSAPTEQVEVNIPLDSVNPPAVSYNGVTTIAAEDRPIIQPDREEYALLKIAAEYARQAIQALPETPFRSASFNVAVRLEKSDAITCRKLFSAQIDSRLEREGFAIQSRSLARRLQWNEGHIIFQLRCLNTGETGFLFTLERQSDAAQELTEWLRTPMSEIERTVTKLIESLTGGKAWQ